MIKVRFVVLAHGEGLPTPRYQSEFAAGLDLLAAIPSGQALQLRPGQRALVPTGIAMEFPKGFEGQVRPRSGLAHRHGVTVLNSPGTIDADYRGEIKVLLINLGENDFTVSRGDRIAQLIVCKVQAAQLLLETSLSATDRGDGGFGSTGT